MFGKLTLSAVPYHEPIVMVTLAVVALLGLGVVGAITYYRKWTYLWTEWLTSVDHKKIGVMYIVVALVMLVRGFADAIMMRGQLALAEGANHGYLPPEHYDQIFTAHGVIMIIFMAMPFMTGLMNLAVPLQIGARDVAFPFLNSLSFWLLVVSAMLVNESVYMPINHYLLPLEWNGRMLFSALSELAYSPGVGVDYYIWALQISGMGTLLTGINFLVTVFKMRAPGMKLMQMPIFTWTCTFANILIVASFPILTAALGLLSLDRYLDMHFFTNELGGNAMMYINLFWAWGHPEVYILILPAFGIFSEVTATFAGKRMFGYKSMVWASAAITFLGFTVWLHHFFTMGSGGDVNGFFGVAPGTNVKSNPNALATTRQGTIFTNVVHNLDDNTVWWEGLDKNPPEHAVDWQGRPWNGKTSGEKGAHPNSRFTAPAKNCPCISPEFESPRGVPISAIVFGGRRARTAPLVYQSRDWTHGVFVGSIMASETTAAATGVVGVVRRDPMAMLPFCGYHMGDYWQHWLDMGEKLGDKAPKIFNVNWFRTDDDGNFLWPGFGDNLRVLEWILKRCFGEAEAVETPIGWEPRPEDIDLEDSGVELDTLRGLLGVDTALWRDEVKGIRDFYQKFGDKLPRQLSEELDVLDARLN